MSAPFVSPSILLHGDAATQMDLLDAGSIDMIYVDPPFGNRQIWSGKAGRFSDRWAMGAASVTGWAALRAHSSSGAALIEATCRSDHDRGYLGFLAGLLLAARRVLKRTGSMWVHFDDTFGAHIRILGSVVFGLGSELANVTWRRTASHNRSKGFGRVHDTIAVFALSRAARWRIWRAAGDLSFGDPACDPPSLLSFFLDDRIGSTAKERADYPTQKPLALIRRFINSATVPGDVVLDPTCGSGTTLVAALQLRRRAIGIDVSADAIAAAGSRLSQVSP